MGQLAGDSLGSQVEFLNREQIMHLYPRGIRELKDGGTFNLIAGQPTDDSELALMLARHLVEGDHFDAKAVRERYVYWLDSGPFDIGNTIGRGLTGRPNLASQANGAMMRISPLGIFGANHDLEDVEKWAIQDGKITHPNPLCLQANALFAKAIAFAIHTGADGPSVYTEVLKWTKRMDIDKKLNLAIWGAKDALPEGFMKQMGWVMIAFRNALYQLANATSFEAGVTETVEQGGDTDTNAAIAGALLGAVYGIEAVPEQWTNAILTCRPEAGRKGVHKPRPEVFWPVDALELAEKLVT